MRTVKKGLLLFSAQITDTVLILLRNMVLARLLSVEQFGVAATFTILMTLIDATQNAGLNRMIIQAKDGDSERVQNSLHAAQFILGLLSSAIILVISLPYSILMRTPHLFWAYLVFALMPLVRSLGHLDTFRLQRRERFGPSIVRLLVPQVVSLLLIWPMHFFFRDYRLALVSLVSYHVLTMAMSHLGAERRYRFEFDRDVLMRARSFGWPILINGMLMFVLMNGDRIIVSNQFGPFVLGGFSAAFLIAMMPPTILSRTLLSMFLPKLARDQGDDARFNAMYGHTVYFTTFLAVGLVAGAGIFGELAMTLIFGAKYQDAAAYLALIVMMQSLRLIRAAPTVAAMAKAETRNPLYSNLVRIVFIPLSFLAAVLLDNIWIMLAVGVVGEVFAAIAASVFARKSIGLEQRAYLLSLIGSLAAMGSVMLVTLAGWHWAILLPGHALFALTIWPGLRIVADRGMQTIRRRAGGRLP